MKNITVVIDQINNLNDLFLTMDSIKSQNYNFNNINLIILDTSTEDVQSLVDNYKHIFLEINVIKVTDINRIDIRGNLKTKTDVEIDINCVFEDEVSLGKNTIIGQNCYLTHLQWLCMQQMRDLILVKIL